MGGSKKGERRGNARKRPAAPDGLPQTANGRRRRRLRRSHETPAEIMNEAAYKTGNRHLEHAVIERRIRVARIINGPSDNIDDITPKEALLMGMRFHLGAIRDLTMMLDQLSQEPVTAATIAQANILEAELERQHAVAGEFAFKCAGYIHPKLQAVSVAPLTGANEATILQQLFDEVDELERSRPIPIEHKPKLITGGGGGSGNI